MDSTAVERELQLSRRQLADAQALARLGSWEWDIPGNRVLWSDELYRLYGLVPGSVVPTYEGFLERVHPDDRAAVDERNHKAFADHRPFEDVKRVVRADGTEFLMRTRGEVVCDEDGAPVRMLGVCEDVTDRVRAHEAQARLAAVVESSEDAIVTTTRDGAVTSWNAGAERLYGHPAAEALGRPIGELVPDRGGRPGDLGRIVAWLERGERIDAHETRHERRDGTPVDVSVGVSPIRGAAGELDGLAFIARDVTERRRFDARLRHVMDHDGLTGLPNRRRFEQELEARAGGPGAVVVLDLDHFKYVNEACGHSVADALLQAVAQLLGARAGGRAQVLARLGGDEFALLLPGAAPDVARAVAADLLEAVRHHRSVAAGNAVRMTVSVGVALYDGAGADADADELLGTAERAMFEAKDGGRDRVMVREAGRQQEARRALRGGWEHRVRTALARDLFALDCQPIVDLATGSVHQYELLLRLVDGPRVAPPGAFLGVAERFGLVKAIDRWVVREAIGLLATHLPADPDLRLEVNLSGRSLGDPELMRLIEQELGRQGVPPGALVFEITETAAIASMDEARRFAEAMRDLGCRFALDDFGAGFGSFYYLKHLPAQYLKIDGEFVRGPRSRTDELIIASIVEVARALGKETIAEFVTDAETLAAVRALGVDFAQGFHTGRPFSVAELGRRIRTPVASGAA